MNGSKRQAITFGYLIGRYLDFGIKTMIVVKIIELSNIFK